MVGGAGNDNDDTRATLWQKGDSWEKPTKIDLGTLRNDNTGYSEARAISGDGQIVVGGADNDNGNIRATLWRIKPVTPPPAPQVPPKTKKGTGVDVENPPAPIPTSKVPNVNLYAEDKPTLIPQRKVLSEEEVALPNANLSSQNKEKDDNKNKDKNPPAPPIISKIDVDNTRKTLAMLGQDSFELLNTQRYALGRAQLGGIADTGRVHVGVQYDYHGNDKIKDHATGFRIRYGVSDNLTLGAGYDYSIKRSLPDSYTSGNDTTGTVGGYARYTLHHGGNQSYIEPSIAYNHYKADIRRPILSNTENTYDTTTVNNHCQRIRLWCYCWSRIPRQQVWLVWGMASAQHQPYRV